MQELCPQPTSPFGGLPLTLLYVRRHRDDSKASDAAPTPSADKWKSFRRLCAAKAEFRLSDRTLAVLEALLTFHPETLLTVGSDDLVVFPSNRQLSVRARGMAISTLRRHLAALVDRGLILRRDSPNRKRFVRRSRRGVIEEAYGFDLGPFVLRAEEFERMAEEAESRRRRTERTRRKISIARRDIAKMIAAGVEAGLCADGSELHRQLQGAASLPPRSAPLEVLEPVLAELTQLFRHCLALLEASPAADATLLSGKGNDMASSARVLPSETMASKEPAIASSQASLAPPPDPTADEIVAEPARAAEDVGAPGEETSARPPTSAITGVPLASVLSACPDISDFAKDEIRSLRDLCVTADLVRRVMGVTQDGWDEACRVMGREGAAIVLAAVLQRGITIKRPGAYLRTLTRRAAAGRFSVWPMLMALENARLKDLAADRVYETSMEGSFPMA